MCQIYYKRGVLYINTEVGISLARAAWDLSLDCWVYFVEEDKAVLNALNIVDGFVATKVILNFVVMHF